MKNDQVMAVRPVNFWALSQGQTIQIGTNLKKFFHLRSSWTVKQSCSLGIIL